MAKIRVLQESVINQIAAGEVIENPASVVKELVENALDAGSSKIEIEIRGGGFLLIQVSDDGEGMSSDDAYLAFERHATSKIASFEELYQLVSMGFRGEALASIAAVSKVDLETSDGLVGTKVGCYGGKIISHEVAARSQGTTISVSSLFYNVPARKKFQKSVGQSTSDIVKMVAKLALAHRKVAFVLRSHEKELLRTSGDPAKGIDEVLGSAFSLGLKSLSFEEEGMSVEGFIGSPIDVRQNRSGQYLFINSRPVHSFLIANAVKEGFATRIGMRDYPIFVLWIEINPALVDVNVHPQKSEVRFQEEGQIEQFIRRSVQKALTRNEGAPFFPSEQPKEAFQIESMSKYFQTVESVSAPKVEVKQELRLSVFKEEIELLFLFKEFAICRIDPEEELPVLVHLTRASFRIQFETILKRLSNKGGEMQMLMFPKVITLNKEESLLIEPHLEFLHSMGIGIRPFGKECFVIDSIAPFFALEEVEEMLVQFMEDFKLKKREEEIAKKAASYQRPRMIRPSEAKEILLALLKTEDPYFAPNGLKIMTPLQEKAFDEILDQK